MLSALLAMIAIAALLGAALGYASIRFKVDGDPLVEKIDAILPQTQFGSYDAQLIRAVEARWFNLLDSTSFVQRAGKVVVEFRLNVDGRITDIKTSENEVGEILALLCQRAIMDPAPYGEWPRDMRSAIGATYRDVTFTFYYN
jgi:hypothetical protein